jgi:hypothetical protein
MKLSAELWESLIRSIRCDPRRGCHENRKKPRVYIRARITLTPLAQGRPAGESFEVWTRDISASGISFRSRQFLERHQQLLVGLPRVRATPALLLATVCQCRQLTDGLYSVGLVYQALDVGRGQPQDRAVDDLGRTRIQRVA